MGSGTPTNPSMPLVTERQVTAIVNSTWAMHSEMTAKAIPETRATTKPNAQATGITTASATSSAAKKSPVTSRAK